MKPAPVLSILLGWAGLGWAGSGQAGPGYLMTN